MTSDPYDPRANNATFDFTGFMIRLGEQLDLLRPELPRGANPLNIPEVRRKLTVHDPLLFAVLYLPHLIKMDPTRRTDAPGNITFADLHLELCRYARRWEALPEPRQSREAFIAPRSCGKSTWLFLILPMWAMAHRHIDFIAAFSSAGPQATKHLAGFKNELDTNELLRTDFPKLCAAMKRPGGQSVADTQKMYFSKSQQTFAAAGLDEEILGLTDPRKRRPQLIIMDDIEPDEANYSQHQAGKRMLSVRDTILPMNERAHVALVGTVTMLGSLVHQLVQTKIEKEEPADWIVEERFQVNYFDPIPDGTRSIWAEKWPLEYLEAHQHERGYKKNFLNQPVPEGTAFWKQETFTYGSFPCQKYLLQVDPATTKTATSDYYGLTVIGFAPPVRDELGQVLEPPRCLVLYAKAFRATPAEIRQRITGLISTFDDREIYIGRVRIEVNQGGDTWKEVFKDLPVPLLVHTESVKKEVRAADLLTWYERRQVVHEKRLPEAENQMMSFPNVLHDDLVDAVGAGVRYFLERKRRKTRVRRGTYV